MKDHDQMDTTTSLTAVRTEIIDDVLRDLRIAPMSWRVRNVTEMLDELIDGWRAFGILTDIPVDKHLVHDMYVHPLTGTVTERLTQALEIGARVTGHRIETGFAGSGGARMWYADQVVLLMTRHAVSRGIFFLTAEQIETVDAADLDARWR